MSGQGEPEPLRAALERWARYQDAGLERVQIEVAAIALREAAGMPPGCYADDPLPDGPDPGARPEDLEALHYERLEVSYEVPSSNVLLRMHHRERQRMRDALYAQIVAQRGKGQPDPVPRRVHYRVYRRRLITDQDNLIGGLKLLQDVLESVGLIWSDEHQWIVASREQHLARGTTPRVEIEVWDYPQSVWSDRQRRMVERAVSEDRTSGQDKRSAASERARAPTKVRGWRVEEEERHRVENKEAMRRRRRLIREAKKRKGRKVD